MELKKCTNKKFMIISYNSYLKATKDNIWKAYGRPSQEKVEAFGYCKELCNKYKGRNLKIVGQSTYVFTAGFLAVVDGKESFVYITPSNNWYRALEDLKEEQ